MAYAFGLGPNVLTGVRVRVPPGPLPPFAPSCKEPHALAKPLGFPGVLACLAIPCESVRQWLRWLVIIPILTARHTEHGSGLGVFRWSAERTISWLPAVATGSAHRDPGGFPSS